MISETTIQAVKDQHITYQVVSQFVKLKKEGADYKGLCPFHNEKTPSFSVSMSRNIYKCFGCGKSGDGITFLMDHEKKTYIEAIKILAETLNIEIEEPRKEKSFVKPLPRLEKLGKKTLEWFEKERKISNNTLLRFGITESNEYMPQLKQETPVICFNYYRHGEVVNIKFRGPKKSFKLAKDAELIFYNLQAIENEKECVIVEGECFHPSAQVLTENGWVSFGEWGGEQVAQYHDSGQISFVSPIGQTKKEYCGDLLEYSNQNLFYSLTTPNHNLVFVTPDNEIKKLPATEMPNDSRKSIPRVALHNGKGIDLTDDEIRFSIAVSADFSLREGGDLYAAFKKERKKIRLCSILDSLIIPYSCNIDKRGYYSFFIRRSNRPVYVFKKFPHSWIFKSTQAQKKLIIEEILFWDGNSVPNRNQIEYSSALIENATFIQTISSLCGYCSTIIKRENQYGKWFKVSILFNKTNTSSQGLKRKSIQIPYKGLVYCLSVPTGMLLVRQKNCISVSGNCDSLSLYEAEIYNSVSVPNGASTGTQKLEYLDNCWSNFEDKEKVVLFLDNDAPGIKLKEELARRLGYEKCWVVDPLPDCKDANEVLVKYGPDRLKRMVLEAKQWPLEGLVTMDDMFEEVLDYYENGYPQGFKADIPEFDDLLSFYPGQLTIITGSPGSGKSEFLDWIMTRLARKHDWKWGICSFECPPPIHVTKLAEKITDKSFSYRKDPNHRMSRMEFEYSISVIDKFFSFINLTLIDITMAGLVAKAEELVKRKGIKGLLFDPWNCIEAKYGNESETKYVLECLNMLIAFAEKYKVHVFLVAHPTKLRKDPRTNQLEIPNLYSISGSAHFFNRTHNGISVYRDFATNTVDIYVQKVKWSWLGKIGFCSFNYDTMTRAYNKI